MASAPLSQAKTNAVLACIYLGILHYTFILMLLAANLTPDSSFVPLLFALLVLAHASIGFVSGYVAATYQHGFRITLAATLLAFIVGLFGAFSIIAILSTVFSGTQRPIVQHMLAYVLTLGSVGICTSFVSIVVYSTLHRAFTNG